MPGVPLLSCERISKTYGLQPLFANVSLTLLDGDRVGLVGPNGSGKTTLLKILAGLELPDAGTRSQRKHLRLGYVPQDPAFPEDGTIESVLAGAVPAEAVEDVEAAGRVATVLRRAEPGWQSETLEGPGAVLKLSSLGVELPLARLYERTAAAGPSRPVA
jgi:ATP-binding cassette subfamily F protein uup